MKHLIEQDRKDIDNIDIEIVALLERRFIIAEHIGLVKRVTGVGIVDTSRESKVIEAVRSSIKHEGYAENVVTVFSEIIFQSKDVQASIPEARI